MLIKERISEESVKDIIQNILLGKDWPENIKLANLTTKQIENIKFECYRNLGSMLAKMQLLDNYLKDKTSED